MTSCYPGRRMRWSGVTDAIARCKNRSIGYARKPRSAHAWRWTCGEKPKRQGATKPSTPYMRHVLPEATRYPCYSLPLRGLPPVGIHGFRGIIRVDRLGFLGKDTIGFCQVGLSHRFGNRLPEHT